MWNILLSGWNFILEHNRQLDFQYENKYSICNYSSFLIYVYFSHIIYHNTYSIQKCFKLGRNIDLMMMRRRSRRKKKKWWKYRF
jgi:hypothetical protein